MGIVPAPVLTGQAARLPRQRIVDATVAVIAEKGYAHARIGDVVSQARVSRRTFHSIFSGLDEALIAVMDDTLERVGRLASEAFETHSTWHEGMFAALAAILTFFDARRALARVCIVESLAGSPSVLEHRNRVVKGFRSLVVANIDAEVSHPSPVAAEAALASVMGVVHTRLTGADESPLIALLGPLIAIIAAPAAAAPLVYDQMHRGDELAQALRAVRADVASEPARPVRPAGPFQSASMLDNPSAHRARECVVFLAHHPGASNREIADGIGVAHQSQVSRLLSNLRVAGLVSGSSEGAGRRNVWRLSDDGERAAAQLSVGLDMSASEHNAAPG